MTVIETIDAPVQRPFYAPGWYRDLSNDEYHGSFGTSSSQLKVLLEQTPAYQRYHSTNPKETTAAMALGTAVHALVLEPEKFDEEVAVLPEINRRTKIGQEEFAEFHQTNASKTIITPEQYEKAKLMAGNVLAHPVARILVEDAVVESSIYWWYHSTDPDDDTHYKEMVKVRPDGLCRSHPIIFDLKTTVDATESEFQRTILNRGYHISAAMYKDGINQCQPLLDEMRRIAYTNFVFIVVENEPPYQCALYEIDQEALDIGQSQLRRAMHYLKRAREKNWPSFPEEIRMIGLPHWANRPHMI